LRPRLISCHSRNRSSTAEPASASFGRNFSRSQSSEACSSASPCGVFARPRRRRFSGHLGATGAILALDPLLWLAVAKRDDGSFVLDETPPFADLAVRIRRDDAPPGDFVALGRFLVRKLKPAPLRDHV